MDFPLVVCFSSILCNSCFHSLLPAPPSPPQWHCPRPFIAFYRSQSPIPILYLFLNSVISHKNLLVSPFAMSLSTSNNPALRTYLRLESSIIVFAKERELLLEESRWRMTSFLVQTQTRSSSHRKKPLDTERNLFKSLIFTPKNAQQWKLHPLRSSLQTQGEIFRCFFGCSKSIAKDDAAWHAATSTTKASRLSVSQSESNNHSRPARSSSVTRPSISTLQSQYNNNYSSNRSSSTNILNTSSASVSSYIRPSSSIPRSTSSTRPSTPTSRTTPSRASTPSRIRTVSTSSTAEKPRPISQRSRPSTPSSRPQVPANLHSPSAPSTRSLSRPSTPTRRSSIPSLSPSSATSSSTSVGRVPLNGRSSAPSSRPSSPSPRIWAPPQPVVPPDFPLDTPPNLRTTLPDRPVSAGRSRPGVNTLKGNTSETQASVNMPRRASSPIVSRGRSTEPVSKSRGFANGNGHHADVHEPRKVSHDPEVAARRSVKALTNTTDNSGFGRNISKKSLDMAIKHMDIRNGSGNHRALSSTTLFPQSIRNSTHKSQYNRGSSAPPTSIEANGNILNKNNGSHFDVVNGINRNMIKGREIDERQYSAKLSEIDVYESSRYDALLLKEDLKNTNWLHSVDDKFDQGSLLFDNGFENLPEPFGLL
ncbi:unnamed protein product [Vicia faba]|uniref:Uncharacterized protein n=1 Tax=Vicia faba TaxID=3906 RepID=A0AAV1B0F8_VICFA|nr:unnamed protein product [Vicia faba]